MAMVRRAAANVGRSGLAWCLAVGVIAAAAIGWRAAPLFLPRPVDWPATAAATGSGEPGSPGRADHAAQLSPIEAQELYRQGLAAEQAGNTPAALQAYRRALAHRPDWHELANDIAWILATTADRRAFDPQEALRLAQRLCPEPASAPAGFLDTLAAACAACGRFHDAIRHAETALQRAEASGDSPRARDIALRLSMYRARRAWRELPGATAAGPNPPVRPAIAEKAGGDLFADQVRRLIDWPRSLAVRVELAWTLATDADPRIRDGMLALRLAQSVVEQSGEQEVYRPLLAAAHAELGDFRQAAAVLRPALAGELPPPVRQQVSQQLACYERGVPWRVATDPPPLDEVAADRRHRRAKLLYTAAGGLRQCGLLAEAAQFVAAAQRLDADGTAALGETSNGILVQEGAAQARQRLERALQRQPNHVGVLVQLGRLAEWQGEVAAALDSYQRAYEITGEAALGNDVAWILATHPRAEIRDGRRAAELAGELCRAFPRRPRLLDTLAAALAEAGHFAAAVETADEALRLSESQPQLHGAWQAEVRARRALYRRAVAYRESAAWLLHAGQAALAEGQLHEAHLLCEAAARMGPDNPDVMACLGNVYERAGRTADALALYERALYLRPGWTELANDMAWIWATHPEESFRQPHRAVDLARRLCAAHGERWELWDTLAAAYAAAGSFAEAVAAAETALEKLGPAHVSQATAVRGRQTLYRRGAAYVEREDRRPAEPPSHRE